MQWATSYRSLFVLILLGLSACGGGGSSAAPTNPPALPPVPALSAPSVTVSAGIKQLIFSWQEIPAATHYRLLENPDGSSGFTQVGANIAAGTMSVKQKIAVHFFNFDRALYIVEACDVNSCISSTEVNGLSSMLDAIGYFKASNTWPNDSFGVAVAVSADGGTLAVGAVGEDSGATGINGDQYDDSRLYESAGAVYVFRLDGTDWSQQAYVKASNTGLINLSGRADYFGKAVALSADGNTLVVGAPLEDSNATGINGDQNDNSADGSGAVYVFRFNGADWIQQAYVKASSTQSGDLFGWSVAISSDSNTLAVNYSDAVSVFRFDGSDWSQQAYIQSANTESGDSFGLSLALSTDGNTLAVGAYREDSNATGINGNQNDNSADRAGAAYVFRSDGTNWTQQAYIKASNTQPIDFFGSSVALSSDGNTLAVGAYGEDSIATGINGVQSGNDLYSLAGAAYVFRFDGADWSQQAYAKASNTQVNAYFGHAVALSADGNILAISAPQEASLSIGVGGDQSLTGGPIAVGAVYVFGFDGTNWSQRAYVKPSNSDWSYNIGFGWDGVVLSADGQTLAVGGNGEESNATGVNGNQHNNDFDSAGAVYLY